MMRISNSIEFGDISREFFENACRTRAVACDIETTGLDWKADRIATVQIHVPGYGSEIVKISGGKPDLVCQLLESKLVQVVFHHALFDLRFMSHAWGVHAQNVACTKIIAKIVYPNSSPERYKLKSLLHEVLKVEIDKSLQTSDWGSEELTPEQISYAVGDVKYLIQLLSELQAENSSSDLDDIVANTFQYIPIRVMTDLLDCGDVFSY